MSTPLNVDVAIVGAGIAGLYQLHRVRELGLTACVLEAAEDVGGTWYWNRYPGARCDVESVSYSYSFSPELEQEWVWTEKYPTQPEILAYLNHVAERFDLRKDIFFRTKVTEAVYSDETKRWLVRTAGGLSISSQFVIMATGCLSASKEPEIPGIERFKGAIYHTARWPHGGVDFTGRRVGVIGTGSSGIQAIPLIAHDAAELVVFQRTPNFSIGARNRPLAADELSTVKAKYRQWRSDQRTSGFGVPAQAPTKSALEVTDAERSDTYEAGWQEGTLIGLLGAYSDTLTDKAANETAAEFIRSKIRSIVTDPGVAETLSPRSFPFGTKRPCLDTGYYDTFNKDHVSLVDVRKTPLVAMKENGLSTTAQEYTFDDVVFATGFDAMTGALNAIDIRGRNGETLKDKWRDGPHSFLGIGIAGFPNLFTITGPSSPSVLSNMMVSIEQHVEWITDCISYMRNAGVEEIEAVTEAEDEWSEHVAEVGGYTLYPTAESWYMGSNVPGKPRLLMAYIGGVGAYREKCDAVAAKGYEGFALTKKEA